MTAPHGDLEIRRATDFEPAQFIRTTEATFGYVATEDDVAFWSAGTEWDRFLVAVDAGQVVGGAGALSMELTLPGAGEQPCPSLPAGGVTAVGVLPTHRRRGLQRRLMGGLLAGIRERGEPVAVLTASESLIYRRYGYGLAASFQGASLATVHAGFMDSVPGGGRVRLLDADEAGKVLPGLHERCRRLRPGDVSRPAGLWERHLRDRPADRDGGSARFDVLHESASGEPDGYASYRFHHRLSGERLQDHRVRTVDVYAVDPPAHAAVWRFLLDLDLVDEVEVPNLPLDDPLRWRLADPRRLRTVALADHLWVRLVDVVAALSARRYPAEGRLVLEVLEGDGDPAAGRYVLEAGPDGAGCRRARKSDRVDLALALADLGAAYLGGVAVSTLAAAGRAEERVPGSLDRADALFASRPLPWCGTEF
jgi:predicted acetyltransferase